MVAILVAAIAMFAVGALWFTVIFGRLWSRLMNFTPEASAKAMQGGMTTKMIAMFTLNLISASVLPMFLLLSYSQFLFVVFIIWIGFTLPAPVNTYLWEGKSLKLVAINAGGSLAAFVAGSIALYSLQ